MPKLFVSYSRVDRVDARKVIDNVRRTYGYDSVWFDDDLQGGDDWWQKILDSIAASDIFLYLLSNDSIGSAYCQAEKEEARRLQKAILPVLIRERTRLPDDLQAVQYVDLTPDENQGEAYSRLYAAINRLDAQKPSKPPKPRSPERTPKPNSDSTPAPASGNPNPPAVAPTPTPPQSGCRPTMNQLVIGIAVTVIGGLILAFLLGQLPLQQPQPSDTPTPSATVATQVTPTDGPTATATPTPTSISSATSAPPIIPTDEASATPTPAPRTASITLYRRGDTLAVCANDALDLSTLVLDFDNNFRYTLGEEFAGVAQTQAGECLCLEQENARFDAPGACGDIREVAGDNWRNATIDLTWQGADLGSFEAQVDTLDTYSQTFSLELED